MSCRPVFGATGAATPRASAHRWRPFGTRRDRPSPSYEPADAGHAPVSSPRARLALFFLSAYRRKSCQGIFFTLDGGGYICCQRMSFLPRSRAQVPLQLRAVPGLAAGSRVAPAQRSGESGLGRPPSGAPRLPTAAQLLAEQLRALPSVFRLGPAARRIPSADLGAESALVPARRGPGEASSTARPSFSHLCAPPCLHEGF